MNEDLKNLSRQDLHEISWDAIAAEGKKPSMVAVRKWTLKHA